MYAITNDVYNKLLFAISCDFFLSLLFVFFNHMVIGLLTHEKIRSHSKIEVNTCEKFRLSVIITIKKKLFDGFKSKRNVK